MGSILNSLQSINSFQTKSDPRQLSIQPEVTDKPLLSPVVTVQEIKIDVDNEEKIDINQTIEQEKSSSIIYQIMLAIARQNKETQTTPEDQSPDFLQQSLSFDNQSIESDSFNLSFSQVSYSEIQLNNNQSEINLSFRQSFEASLSVEVNSAEQKKSDPLILNLDNTDFNFEENQKITFDLNADGQLDTFSNLSHGNQFLAFDKNNNGIIDDGSELFGDTRGAINGFADLAQYDSNNDNQIDANDNIFKNLLLMSFDANNQQQLSYLSSQNIKSLKLNEQQFVKNYSGNNELISSASFERHDGNDGVIGDFLLAIG